MVKALEIKILIIKHHQATTIKPETASKKELETGS
jgi:hypothetical protein